MSTDVVLWAMLHLLSCLENGRQLLRAVVCAHATRPYEGRLQREAQYQGHHMRRLHMRLVLWCVRYVPTGARDEGYWRVVINGTFRKLTSKNCSKEFVTHFSIYRLWILLFFYLYLINIVIYNTCISLIRCNDANGPKGIQLNMKIL